MGRTYSNITDAFAEAKKVIQENNITIQEISENTNIDEQLVHIIFNEVITNDLSRVLDFLKIKLIIKPLKFKPYSIIDDKGTSIKIKRRIKPYCSMYYDKATGKYYNFNVKHKSMKLSQKRKDIIIDEMDSVLKEYLTL